MYSTYQPPSTTGEAPKLQPDETAAVGILQHLNKVELQNLLDDDTKLEEIIQDLAQVKKLHRDREMTMVQNKSLADYNVSLQPQFEQLKQAVSKCYEEANKLKTSLAVDKSKLDSCRGDQSLETIAVMLQTSASSIEEESETLADNFCDKKIEVETFLDEFLSKRTLAHLRLVKSQKMQELVREQQSAPVPVQAATTSYAWNSHVHQHSPSHMAHTYPANQVPYPAGSGASYGMAMPQAGYYAS